MEAVGADAEVIVIGSGIGGLCCAGLLARGGRRVLVLEAHSQPGGAAHGFRRGGYHFESGPSLWSGLGRWPSTNPLAQVLRALEERVELMPYHNWEVRLPEGVFRIGVGQEPFAAVVRQLRGPAVEREWRAFLRVLAPIAAAADALPLLALRPGGGLVDPLVRGPSLVPHLRALRHLGGSFGPLVEQHLSDPFLRHWVDLLSFLISGMATADTNAAAMATLFGEWFREDSVLEMPRGGSPAVVAALVRGLERHGGALRLGCRVERLVLDGDRVVGVRLANGATLRAQHVVSNADAWGTAALMPEGAKAAWCKRLRATPACASFLHLHLGFRHHELADLPVHTVWVGDWQRGVMADRNLVVLSIPSVLDPGLAPAGCHGLHGYTPASEPWSIWKEQQPDSDAYHALKHERCAVFHQVLEQQIPNLPARLDLMLEGSPLSHRRFLHVHQGSYGPALSAAHGLFPDGRTPVAGLWRCGASTFPGIGIPAVAASGALAAHAILGARAQSQLLGTLGL